MTAMPLILGHRGASAVAPENTLAAFSRAIQDGAEGIEFDVRLSRDGMPVVIHDANLKRTAPREGLVSELSCEELQKIDVGSWFAKASFEGSGTAPQTSYSGEKLPTLAQVLQLFSENRGLLYIEMKSDEGHGSDLAAAVVERIRETNIPSRVVVESFDLPAIAEIKRIDSGIRTAALFEPKLSRPISTLRRSKMVDLARDVSADEIALHYTLAGPGVVERASKYGLETVVWTVDDPQWIGRARSLGIKALISNNPGMMVLQRNAAGHG